MNAKTSIKNPLTDLLAGRVLDQIASTDIASLIEAMNVKADDARAAAKEAERIAHAAIGAGTSSISIDGIALARLEVEFCDVAQATLANALIAAKVREADERKAARIAVVEDHLGARDAAGKRLEDAIVKAAAAYLEVVAEGRAAVRASGIKMEASAMNEFRPEHPRHLMELELWRQTGGMWHYTRIPGIDNDSFPPLSRLVANSGGDLLTEMDIRG
jgi:hypothetical protein